MKKTLPIASLNVKFNGLQLSGKWLIYLKPFTLLSTNESYICLFYLLSYHNERKVCFDLENLYQGHILNVKITIAHNVVKRKKNAYDSPQLHVRCEFHLLQKKNKIKSITHGANAIIWIVTDRWWLLFFSFTCNQAIQLLIHLVLQALSVFTSTESSLTVLPDRLPQRECRTSKFSTIWWRRPSVRRSSSALSTVSWLFQDIKENTSESRPCS